MRQRKGRPVAALAGLIVLLLLGLWWPQLVAWYEFYSLFESIGKNEQGYPEHRHRQTGIVFVRVPGGTFLMGSPNDEEGPKLQSGPPHEVTLDGFLIAKYEVCQGEWSKLMDTDELVPSEEGSLPVVGVSWDECMSFCVQAGLLLPKESQWEYACRAGTMGPYAGTGNPDEMGWHGGNSGGRRHAVGRKQPNDFGIFDMHGNVAERCADESDAPLGLGGHVVRGGSYADGPAVCRSAMRIRGGKKSSSASLGFRPAYYPLP